MNNWIAAEIHPPLDKCLPQKTRRRIRARGRATFLQDCIGAQSGETLLIVSEPPGAGCYDDDYTNEPASREAGLDNVNMSARYLLRMPNFFLTTYAPDMAAQNQ